MSTAQKTSKRFYTMASVKKTAEGYAVQLDGKTIKTPEGQDLVAPSKALADAVMQEWADQIDEIDPQSMPITQILTTAIDTKRQRGDITDKLMRYLDTDLICYWAKEPEKLAARQKEIWGRWIKWFDEHFEVPLYTTKKIETIKQDPEAHKRLWNYIESLDDTYFTILQIMTADSGSVILGAAFAEGDASPDDIYKAAYLEELYRAEFYSEDEYGAAPEEEAEREQFKSLAAAARDYINLANA